MTVPQEIMDYMKEQSSIYGDENTVLERLLREGLPLPAAEIPEMQWYMAGASMGGRLMETRQGPYGRSHKYMFVAVAPDFDDHQQNAHFSSTGPSQVLLDAVKNAGFKLEECYFSTVMRFPRPRNASSFKQCWLRPGWELLKEEVQVVRPEAVCFLGSEVLKLAKGNQASLESVRGQPFQFETLRWACPAMAVQSHYNFISNTAGFPAFVKQLEAFRKLLVPGATQILEGVEYPDRDYKVLWDLPSIEREIRAEIDNGTPAIAIDVETASDSGRPDHRYLITFQWSSRPGHARIIPLLVERPEPMETVIVNGAPVEIARYGGAGVDRKSINDRVEHWEAVGPLIQMLLDSVSRIAGHNVRYDLVGLRDEYGFDIRRWIKKIFDTMQAYHVLEKDEYGLKQLTLRFTDMGAYDAPMMDWVIRNCGKGKLFPGAAEDRFFHEFRDICYKYLLPYAMCDTDATFRIWPILEAKLLQPGNEKLAELYYTTLLPLNSPVIDVETFGLPVDEERATQLSFLYQRKYDELMNEFRELIRWPEFNPNSPRHVPALLFKAPYKDYKKCEAQVPEGAITLGLEPAWETGKYGDNWDEIPPNELEYHSPSCEAKALKKILTSLHLGDKEREDEARKVLKALCEIKDMKQFVTMFMRDPVTEEPASEEHPRYGKGLRGCILDNKRMRTQLSLLSETHRWKHRSPNLANLPKTKEENIQALFSAHTNADDEEFILSIDDGALEVKADGGKIMHVPKIRTIFKALPGHVLIEADWKSAELWVMGLLSRDTEFIRVLKTAPDMHLYNAFKIFKFDLKGMDIMSKADCDKLKKIYKQQRFAVKAVCLAEGTLVLTETRGFVPIEQVLVTDRVWDGVEWVAHEGLLYKGVKEVIEVNGVWLTPDHKILTDEGMVPACQAVSTPHQLSARVSADGRLWVSNSVSAGASSGSSSSASVAPSRSSTGTMSPTCSLGNPSSASSAVSPRPMLPSRTQEGTRPSCLTRFNAAAGSTGLPLPYLVAGILLTIITPIMAAEALLSVVSGVSLMGHSSPIFKLCLTGLMLPLLWIVWTTDVGTNQVTLGAFLRAYRRGTLPETGGSNTPENACASTTSGSAIAPGIEAEDGFTISSREERPPSKLSLSRTSAGVRTARVYDLYNAGPRHRFQARNSLVGNCFGIAYGLGNSGLADQLSLEFGRYVDNDEAQKIIEGYFKQYPQLKQFFDKTKEEVRTKGYVETPFGSRRYFPGYDKVGNSKRAKMEREGGNAVIQGTVAIMLDKASVLLDQARYDTEFGRQAGWEYVLAVHDAMYVHCRAEVADLVAKVVKWAMESVIIPGYQGLEVDLDILERWGES